MTKKITIFLLLFICFITKAQQVTTLNGSGGGGYIDGSLATAKFDGPWGMCADPTGNFIYIADSFNYKIRKIDLTTNSVSTVAGSTQGYIDGSLLTAKFSDVRGICMDSYGNLFVIDSNNQKVRKIDLSTGMVSTLAGSTQGYADGQGINAMFNTPFGICVDSNNNIYVSEWFGNKIRKITPAGLVTTLAGSNTFGFADGVGAAAQFKSPLGLFADEQNNIFVADTYNSKIRKITPDGTVTTIAGTTYGYLDGDVSQAQFKLPIAILKYNTDSILIADDLANNIRKLNLSTNTVTTFVGSTSSVSGTIDGVGTQALLAGGEGICKDINGTIYFSEFSYSKIRKIIDLLDTENFELNPIKLYPNPNKGNFKINIDINFKIEIYDILGQLVFTKKDVQSETEIETGIKKGIYFVKITTEEGRIATQKMVVD